jgi:hypothetical protein
MKDPKCDFFAASWFPDGVLPANYFLVIDERYPNMVKVRSFLSSGQVQMTRTASGKANSSKRVCENPGFQ